MRKIAVYGSLLNGLGNYGVIGRDPMTTLLCEEVVKIPFGMISYGAFPALVPSDTKEDIFIEIYEVTDETYRRVEGLEGYPSFYQKAKILTTQGEVEIYVIERERTYHLQPVDLKVLNGNWREYKKQHVKTYF